MDNSRSDKGSDDESDPEEQDPFKDSSSDSDGEGCHSSSPFIKAFGGVRGGVKWFLVVASKVNQKFKKCY